MKKHLICLLTVAFALLAVFTACKKETTHPDEPEMVLVQGGTFTMGCTAEQSNDCSDGEKPAHQVTLNNFQIGKYPVTQAQWRFVMGNNPSYFTGDNLPVEQVSWNDVQVYIEKLNEMTGKNYRLPTEAEWEYAARGGNKSQEQNYKYSGSNNIEEVAWYWENSDSKTHPVGTKAPNALGIYDMCGNVWEWCNDRYGDYTEDPQTNPQGPDTGYGRVVRGGSWYYFAHFCRTTSRDASEPTDRYFNLGFRLVLP